VHIVVAAALLRDGRILLCHRSPHRVWYPNVWDLPGGHVEQGESPRAAVVREVREELGVAIDCSRLPVSAQLRVSLPDADLSVWRVQDWKGEPTNLQSEEHDCVAWFDIETVSGLRLPDPAYPALLRTLLA
jgi:8-oxo-dGTP diphosphatase